MPRHAFRFHPEVREAVRKRIAEAVASVNPRRYKQEAPYTAALAHALEGVAYSGPHGHVAFQSTVVDDRGRGAAESWSGADLAITATISDGTTKINKAILIQAKRGHLEGLSSAERMRTKKQVSNMEKLTKHPKVMEVPGGNGPTSPGVYSGTVFKSGKTPRRYDLGDYFVNRVLTTLDGDTRPSFVSRVQDSSLTQLKIVAEKTKE